MSPQAEPVAGICRRLAETAFPEAALPETVVPRLTCAHYITLP